jgi:hypothetical protein
VLFFGISYDRTAVSSVEYFTRPNIDRSAYDNKIRETACSLEPSTCVTCWGLPKILILPWGIGILDTCVWRHESGHQCSVPSTGCSLNFCTSDACLVGPVLYSMHTTNYTYKFVCDSCTYNPLEWMPGVMFSRLEMVRGPH